MRDRRSEATLRPELCMFGLVGHSPRGIDATVDILALEHRRLAKKNPRHSGGEDVKSDGTLYRTASRLPVESDHCRKVELTVSPTTRGLIKLLRKRTHERWLLRKLGCLGGETEILQHQVGSKATGIVA